MILILGVKEWGSIGNFVDMCLDFMEMGGLYQVAGNMLLAVPIGVLLPFISDMRPLRRRILTLAISAWIEVVQFFIIYFFHTVFLFFDVKDAILNVCFEVQFLAGTTIRFHCKKKKCSVN